MDAKLTQNQLIEVDEGYQFYCNNCNYTFTFVYSFSPIPRQTKYYVCANCNSILTIKDLKKMRKNNWFYHYCFSKCYPY
jgi:transcription initiation factor IIE alpha subunit